MSEHEERPEGEADADAADALARSRRESVKLDAPPPSSGELAPSVIVHGRKRRMRMIVIFGVLLVAGVVGALVIADRRATAKADARINLAWSSLSRCLVGEAIKPGERPSVRFRRIQLTAMAMPVDKRRGTDGEPWPATCAQHAYELDRALRDALRAEKQTVTQGGGPTPTAGRDLASTAEALAKTLHQTPKTDSIDLSADIERLFERASAEKMVTVPAPNVPLPPPPASPFDVDAYAAVKSLGNTNVSLDRLFSEPHGDRVLRLVATGESGAGTRLCVLDGLTARCTPTPEKVHAMGDLHLLTTVAEGGAPLFYTGKRGAGGIFRGDDGERIDAMLTFGGVSRKDRSVLLVGPNVTVADDDYEVEHKKENKKEKKKEEEKSPDSRFKLLVGRPGVAPVVTPLPLPEGAEVGPHVATILWDQLLWKARKEQKTHLFAQKIAEDGSLGSATDVGLTEWQTIERGEIVPAIEGCRTGAGIVIRLGSSAHHLAFLGNDGTWKPPVRAGGMNGAMTCRTSGGLEATMTSMSSREKATTWRVGIDQNRCTPQGCHTDHASIEMSSDLAAPDNGQLAAIDLDGRVLLVWTAGVRGGLRMRLAPIRDLAQYPDVVLFDDQLVSGKNAGQTVLRDFVLFGQEGWALLVLDTTSGVLMLKIDKGGSFAPPAVSF